MKRQNLEDATILQIIPAQPGWEGIVLSEATSEDVEQGATSYYTRPIACWALVEISDIRLSPRRIITPLVHSDTGREHTDLEFLLDDPDFLGYASPENPVTGAEWVERIRYERTRDE